MNHAFFRALSLTGSAAAIALLFSSCTVDQDAALFTSGSGAGSATKKKTEKVSTDSEKSWAEKMKEAREEREKERALAEAKKEKELAAKKKADEKKAEEAGPSFAERMQAAREEREKARAEAEKVKAKELAEKKKNDEAEARKLAAEKKKADAEKKLLAEKKAKEEAAKEAAEKKEREQKLAEKAEEAKKREEARLAAKKKADEEREARRLARQEREDSGSREVAAVAERSSGGGFFSRLAVGTPSQYKSEGHDIFVNQRLLGSLSPANAKIEVDLSEQRARVYKTGSGGRQLVIDTAISSGKSGHTTPTGTFRIKEKLVHKRSTLYGTWMSSSGATVRSSGDSRQRPYGASRFVGAEMPYWMRINGGIGMHIGYVPNYPASHGCIRVPSAIQPLIYSKVGVGTSVTIKH